MWWYSASVFTPVRLLKRLGVPISCEQIGEAPRLANKRGLGPYFSRRRRKITLLPRRANDAQEFDQLAQSYADLVRPFSEPIFDEALMVMSDFLTPDARVMDVGCGPGLELEKTARLLPRGEIVGVDISSGMVEEAYERTSSEGISNCAFFQADVGALPKSFDAKFDLIYSCLAHHHYQDPAAASQSILRSLRRGGIYCIIDPGPSWYNRLSSPLAAWADPGWTGFHSPEEFRRLLEDAGFSSTCWFELLPGFGLTVGQK
jgi:SAM-dependent methyltransferase